MIFSAHIPSFIDGAESDMYIIQSIDELLALKYVKNWSQDSVDGLPFDRYSQGKRGDHWLLIGEWQNEHGYKWLVLGYLSEDAGLPEFTYEG